MNVPQSTADVIVDPKAYADRDPVDEAFAWLRRNAPFAQVQPKDYDPFWAVTRYADIQEVERQPEIFGNGGRSVILTTTEADRKVRELMNGSPHLVRTLVQMDAPDHMAYRRLTQGAFLPQGLKRIESRVREIAREAVEKMASFGEHCDFARDVSFLYPLRVIMELLGVPQSDEAYMLKLTQELFGGADPDLNRSGAEVDKIKAVENRHAIFTELEGYFSQLTEDRRRCPRDDVATIIANGEVNGCPMGHKEAMSYYTIVATAGHDTTSNTLAGGLWALADNPDQYAKLKGNPALIPGHIDESIRWESPIKHFMRCATRDVEIAGAQVKAGDWLMMCYQSANRDEAVFDDPFRYNIERSPNRHLAFGYGPHLCLGQHLGRMEMRILWEELLPRLDHVELDGQPVRFKANFVCGPKSVPIRFKMH
ncbi:cytochrome P450 [Sphingobium sp. JS3065]|uniref:cytochrome P450 n=1 Tax=Sphingobium sp. JS3065 TaxID=2970925 RepID=UPI0022640A4C|nr:cytochrome P450 [Sphingobium sp. JS3065]UZW56401.1 cytochrome P450 [Sphingobium sp. JS3065]